ncbi:hypothetical protein IJJ08_04880 [bacterium]|nr:hypothetical protein [bacterium]
MPTPTEQDLIKPKIKRAPQETLKQMTQRLINKVEQPEGIEARRTFGRHQTPEEIRRDNLKKVVLEMSLWIVALLIVFVIVNVNWPTIERFIDWATGKNNPEIVSIPSAPPVQPSIHESIFTGSAYQLGEDLGWLRTELFANLTYYAAGEVISGEYTGARRFFAVGLLISDGSLVSYEFWQLPDGQILLNGEKQNPARWLTLLNDYYVRMFFSDEVIMIDQLVGDWPETLAISPSMLLYRRELLTDLGPYDDILYGSPRLALSLPTQYYQPLELLDASKYIDLKLYSKMYSGEELFAQIAPNLSATDEWIADRYLFGGTKVIIEDKTGVSYVYELVFNDTWDRYQPTRDDDIRHLEFYKQELIKYTATASFASYRQRALRGDVLALPDGQPRMPAIHQGLPGINFATTDFEFTANKPAFASYTSAYTAVCYPRIDAKVLQGITSDDLVQIGRIFSSQLPVYTLRDREHALNRMAYDLKLGAGTIPWESVYPAFFDLMLTMKDVPQDKIQEIRRGEIPLEKLTQSEYVSGTPLLIIPDPWGRYLLVWENDLDFLPDCGIIGPR